MRTDIKKKLHTDRHNELELINQTEQNLLLVLLALPKFAFTRQSLQIYVNSKSIKTQVAYLNGYLSYLTLSSFAIRNKFATSGK